MKRLGLALLMFMILFQAGTVFAEKHGSGIAWWDATQQVERYMQSMLIVKDAIYETVDVAWDEKAKQVDEHAQITSENSRKEILAQKESYVTELDETVDALIISAIFQTYQNEKEVELDAEVETESKAILKSLLSESEK
ncbi:hypothetical protein [Oceanobacillus kapialis]|uniref:Uncharacterized protein n=1 Tax=Oceanobacillus kapialis TaxID=481353 RepID=A0ABW5Q1P1_9BACI